VSVTYTGDAGDAVVNQNEVGSRAAWTA